MEKKQVSELFQRHYRHMYNRARALLYNELENKDVISDIFEHLLKSDTVLLPDTAEHDLK